MNSTGRRGEKTGYLVILLSVVGLLAFSSTMKELSQLHQLALDAGNMVAHWSVNEVAPTEIPVAVAKLETCETAKAWAQSVPSVDLPWLDHVAPEKMIEVNEIERPVAPERIRKAQVSRSNGVRRVDFDPVQVEVRVSTDHAAEREGIMAAELPQFTFKTKNRKHNVIRMNPRDREMLLKTLNRSINLRIAS